MRLACWTWGLVSGVSIVGGEKERRIVQACMRGRHALGTTFPGKIAWRSPYEIGRNCKATLRHGRLELN